MASFDLTIDPTFFDDLAAVAANETRARFRTLHDVENKDASGFDPVTEADKSAERAIRQLIEEHHANHRILGEEEGESGGPSPYRWVIDPVDGTRAFICGIPVWTTLVGLEKDGHPFAGMIDQPILGERWVSVDGQSAQFIDQTGTCTAKTSGCKNLSDARMMVTDIRADAYFTQAQAEQVEEAAAQARVLRQGLDSYGFGLVASGHMDIVIEASLSWYDIAAVIPVIKGAGGAITDWQGRPLQADTFEGEVVVAASDELKSATVKALASALCKY
ncbi:MAG: inositol monophosphatase family protein [Pseudomonadota bacterium]